LLAAKNSVNCQTEMPVIDFFFLHNWQLYTSFWKMLHVNMLWNMPITLPFLKQVHFQHFSYFLWMVTHINLEEKTIYVTEHQ